MKGRTNGDTYHPSVQLCCTLFNYAVTRTPLVPPHSSIHLWAARVSYMARGSFSGTTGVPWCRAILARSAFMYRPLAFSVAGGLFLYHFVQI